MELLLDLSKHLEVPVFPSRLKIAGILEVKTTGLRGEFGYSIVAGNFDNERHIECRFTDHHQLFGSDGLLVVGEKIRGRIGFDRTVRS